RLVRDCAKQGDRNQAVEDCKGRCHPRPAFRTARLSEQRLSAKRFSRPRPETVQCELRFLIWLHVNEDVVVLFFRRLTLPIKVWWIVGRHLDACPPGKDWILFCAAPPSIKYFTSSTSYISVV